MTAALRRSGPGFKAHILEALQRIDRTLDLVFCTKRGHWLVVRRAGSTTRAWWSGTWHAGYDVVLRWCGIMDRYGLSKVGELGRFLPLDRRLVDKVRFGSLRTIGQDARLARHMAEIERSRQKTLDQRRIERGRESRHFKHVRHVSERQWSIGGMAPGTVNDSETNDDVLRRMSARRRAAFLRARGGRLPFHLRELEREMQKRGR